MKKCYRVSIIIILISIFIVSGFKLFNFYLEYSTTNKRNANLHKLYKESISQSSINPTRKEKQQFENLIEMNPDYVGWLEIPNTSISFPVVQLDNEFYLSHNFLKEKDAHGAIFLDEQTNVNDFVLLVHGHHMKDGTMFAGLKKYKKRDYLLEHQEISLDLIYESRTYDVFCILQLDFMQESDIAMMQQLYNQVTMEQELLTQLQEKSIWFEVEDSSFEQILMLSTCDYGTEDQRLLILAKK